MSEHNVLCIEDVDRSKGVEGKIKKSFADSKGNTLFGLAASESKVPCSLLRTGLFEDVYTVQAPTEQERQNAWHQILSTINMLEPQFQCPADAAARLAVISPGFSLADFTHVLCKCVSATNEAQSSDPPNFSYQYLTNLVSASQNTQQSISDLTFASALRSSIPLDHTDNWDGHAGYTSMKEQLTRILEWPITFRATHERLGITSPHGILLHGPHGCGKTMIAKAFLRRLKHANSLYLHGPDIFSKYLGDSEQRLRDLFARARKLHPCIVFVDELDAIGGKRDEESEGSSGVEQRVIGTLLAELDGVEGAQVCVLGCVRDLSRLDAALVRPGRIDHVIEVGLPTKEDRRAILEQLLRKLPMQDSAVSVVDCILDSTNGMTGAQLAGLCREATMIAVEEEADFEHLLLRHFEEAVQQIRTQVT